MAPVCGGADGSLHQPQPLYLLALPRFRRAWGRPIPERVRVDNPCAALCGILGQAARSSRVARFHCYIRNDGYDYSLQPNGWDPSAGFPAMAGLVPFLMKDFVLLAVSIYLLKQDVVRLLHAHPARALYRRRRRTAPLEWRSLFLPIHEIMHQRRNLIGFRVEREVAGVENVNLGVGHVLPIALRLAEIERQVMLAPDHQQTRLLLAHPGLPLGIGVDVRSIVVEEVGLNIRLSRLAQKRELVGPKIRVVRFRIRIIARMASARRGQRKEIGAKGTFVGGPIRPKGATRLPELA